MPTRTKMPRIRFFEDTVRLLSPSPEDPESNSEFWGSSLSPSPVYLSLSPSSSEFWGSSLSPSPVDSSPSPSPSPHDASPSPQNNDSSTLPDSSTTSLLFTNDSPGHTF